MGKTLKKTKEYIEGKNIPQLFENLVAALLYYRPDNHIDFLLQCLNRMQDGAIIHVPKLPPILHEERKPPIAKKRNSLTNKKTLPPIEKTKQPKVLESKKAVLEPHPPTLPKARILRKAILYRLDPVTTQKPSKDKPDKQGTIPDSKEKHEKEVVKNHNDEVKELGVQSNEKPIRKRRAEKRLLRLNKNNKKQNKKVQIGEIQRKEHEEPHNLEQNNTSKINLGKRENKRLKQKEKRKRLGKKNGNNRIWAWKNRFRPRQTHWQNSTPETKDVDKILGYKEYNTKRWETKQKYIRGRTLGDYLDLYSLLRKYSPETDKTDNGLRQQRSKRRYKAQMKLCYRTGRKDIRKKMISLPLGYLDEKNDYFSAYAGDIDNIYDSHSDSEDDTNSAMETQGYFDRPFISVHEDTFSECSGNFIRQNHQALSSVCRMEMKAKQQVYLYQENGYISGIGISQGKSDSPLNPDAVYTKRKDKCGRKKQRVNEIRDINMSVKHCASEGKSSLCVIDYYIDI